MVDDDRRIRVLGISWTDLPPVDRLKITVLVDDSANQERSDTIAKHGLSFLIETKAAGDMTRILMDVGPPSDVALRNAETLGIDLKDIDAIVISHGHYDHTGALLEILKHIGRQVPVVAHPQVFSPKFTLNPKLRYVGVGFDKNSIIAAGGMLLLARNSVRISNGLMTTGEVTRLTDFERSNGFWKVEDGNFVQDEMTDEQAVLTNVKDRGLVILSGCSHPGIVNTLKHAKGMSKADSICAVVGGFHLLGASDDRLRATTDELLGMNPEFVHPCHCTGSTAINRFTESLGARCKQIMTGDTIEF
jgi:7,8-dihydropterin-6-yl-methyl-4-(beta-D-ribofuranosyl)aminobenzene 5'-phosphate synthase